jgi:hypothetical protein
MIPDLILGILLQSDMARLRRDLHRLQFCKLRDEWQHMWSFQGWTLAVFVPSV